MKQISENVKKNRKPKRMPQEVKQSNPKEFNDFSKHPFKRIGACCKSLQKMCKKFEEKKLACASLWPAGGHYLGTAALADDVSPLGSKTPERAWGYNWQPAPGSKVSSRARMRFKRP